MDFSAIINAIINFLKGIFNKEIPALGGLLDAIAPKDEETEEPA